MALGTVFLIIIGVFFGYLPQMAFVLSQVYPENRQVLFKDLPKNEQKERIKKAKRNILLGCIPIYNWYMTWKILYSESI